MANDWQAINQQTEMGGFETGRSETARSETVRIEAATAAIAAANLDRLTALLINNVDSGASIGWLPPLAESTAQEYWRERIAALEAGKSVLLLAWQAQVLAGSAQLALEPRANGNHRAEVQKMIVHTGYRRRGIARRLLAALEAHAIAQQRSLLYLDTRAGDAAEWLYTQAGYVRAGAIANYVRNPDGKLHPTVIYYKILEATQS